MIWRSVGAVGVVGALFVPSCQPGCEPPPPPEPRSTTEIVALMLRGVDTPWAALIDDDDLEARYALDSLEGASLGAAGLRLTDLDEEVMVAPAALRSAFGLPSASFTVEAVERGLSIESGVAFIGNSLGVSMTDATPELPTLLDGMFATSRFDSVGGRCTAAPGCRSTGVDAARLVPAGTGMAVIELGINDAIGSFPAKIDQMMGILVDKGVEVVVWTTSSTRSTYAEGWAARNNADLVAALDRWPQLVVIDWNLHSSGDANGQDGWFTSDRIHLTRTGQVQMARFLRDAMVLHAPPPPPPPPPPSTDPPPTDPPPP